MRGKQWLLACALALACAAGVWGAVHLAAPEPAAGADPRPLWVLRDAGGLLAQYDYGADEAAAPVQTWQVYTALLPEQDAERLRSGIPVYSHRQLMQLVEDLGG